MKKHSFTLILIMFFCAVSLLCSGCSKCSGVGKQSSQNNSESTDNPDVNTEILLEGSFYDNIGSFDTIDSYDNASDMTKEYLRSVKYHVEQIDTESGIATVTVSLPNVTKAIETALENVQNGNSGTPYTELLDSAKEFFIQTLRSSEMPYSDHTVEIPIKQTATGLKLVADETWNELIIGNLETSYYDFLKQMIGGMTNE